MRGDAGIGDHQIQTAESGHRLLDGGLRGRFNPHVGNQSQRAVGADLSDGALDAVIVDVRDDHARSAVMQELGGLETDAAHAAGDERDLAVDGIPGHWRGDAITRRRRRILPRS